MKKALGVVFAFLIVFMAACGDDSASTTSGDQKNNENETVENEGKSSGEIQQEWLDEQEKKKEEDNKQKEYDEETGEGYVDGVGYIKTLGVGYNDEVGIDGTDGDLKPIKFGDVELTIGHMEIDEIQPNEEDDVLFFGQDEPKAIIVDMKAENKSDQDIEFYPEGSVLVTDTGLQLEEAEMLDGDIGGDFYGGVKKEGIAVWVLDDDADAENIKSVKMIVDPPYDEEMEEIGEEKRLDFEIVSYDEARKKDKK